MCSSYGRIRTKSLICFIKSEQRRRKSERQSMIHWRNKYESKKKKRTEKKRTRAQKWIFDVWQNRKSLLWVSNAPFNESFFLPLVAWIHNSSLHVSTAADFPFETSSIGIWCVFPIALRTSSERKYLWTRAKLRMMLSLRNFFAFCLFVFLTFVFNCYWMGRSGNVDAQSIKHSF